MRAVAFLRNLKSFFALVSSFRLVSLRRFLVAAALVLLALIGFIFFGFGPLPEDRLTYVPERSSMRMVARALERDGVIRGQLPFRILGRLSGLDSKLKSGEYLIPARAGMARVLSIIATGERFQRRFSIPEGLTNLQLFEVLESAEGVVGVANPRLYKEGSFFPETYVYYKGDRVKNLLARMKEALDSRVDALWKERASETRAFIRNKRQAIILASLIEKETGLSGERGLVASVFYNRLRKGMRLQTDPALVYWESRKYGVLGRGLKRSELRGDHPYNTYTRFGLTPTPIANPGLASLKAALNPKKSSYYYFVADGKGGHGFSKTLQEHERRVLQWRRIEAARK